MNVMEANVGSTLAAVTVGLVDFTAGTSGSVRGAYNDIDGGLVAAYGRRTIARLPRSPVATWRSPAVTPRPRAEPRLQVRTWPRNAVVEPGVVRPSGADHYRVFTPYLRAWLTAERRSILAPPGLLRMVPGLDPGRLPDPSTVQPSAERLPAGGETVGREALRSFLRSGLDRYERDRDNLQAAATSRVSPYLRFGCLSAAEVAALAGREEGGASFLRQLAWRDFFRQLLAAEPRLLRENLRQPTGRIRNTTREAAAAADDLARWQAGRTGHPLVDAAMRQLQTEGWLPNRARLVAASSLTRILRVDWREGAAHVDRLLVDGDPASNAGNWQWVAALEPCHTS